MKLSVLFDMLEHLEDRMSILYAHFHNRWIDDMEASMIFYRLYLEEKSHLFILQRMRDVIEDDSEVDCGFDCFDQILEIVEDTIKSNVTLEEGIVIALKLEERAGECYTSLDLLKKLEGITFIAKALYDPHHYAELKALAVRRNISY